MPPRLSSFLHAFRIITPAQYWISGGSEGGGLGDSISDELCRNVNRSTSENTFVMRGVAAAAVVVAAVVVAAEAVAVVEDEDEDDAFSFSLPRPVAELRTFMSELGSFVVGVTGVTGLLLLLGPATG